MEPITELLEPWLAPFLEGAPAQRRIEVVLDAAQRLGGSRSIAVWSSHRGPWRIVASTGEREHLPSAGQVRAVAAGELCPELPEGRVVLSGGASWALALGGRASVDPSLERNLDLLEAFLVAISAIEEGAPLRDVEIPGFQPAPPLPHRGTHGPSAPAHPGRLRALLQEIRDLEEQLVAGELGDEERRDGRRRLDQLCERAGDLLMEEGRDAAA